MVCFAKTNDPGLADLGWDPRVCIFTWMSSCSGTISSMKQAQTGSLSGTRVFSLHLLILKAAYGLNKVMTRKRKNQQPWILPFIILTLQQSWGEHFPQTFGHSLELLLSTSKQEHFVKSFKTGCKELSHSSITTILNCTLLDKS